MCIYAYCTNKYQLNQIQRGSNSCNNKNKTTKDKILKDHKFQADFGDICK